MRQENNPMMKKNILPGPVLSQKNAPQKRMFHSPIQVLDKIALILVFTSALPFSFLRAQDEKTNDIFLGAGLQHMTLLDRQASPVPFEGVGPAGILGFEHKSSAFYWYVEACAGKLAFQEVNKSLRFTKREMTAFSTGINISALFSIRRNEKLNIFLGPQVKEDVLVDFEGIGVWPYLAAPGGLFVKIRGEYELNERHEFGTEIAIPIFAWLTDMPYSQIPRVEGRAPDAVSLFKSSTKIATWNRYQRADIRLTYTCDFSERWSFKARYDWAWYHDSQPFDMWTFQGNLLLGLSYGW